MSAKDHKQEERKQFILDQVAAELKARVPEKLKSVAQTFAQVYYANVSLDDLTETSLESLVASVYGMWSFSLERASGQTKIRVYTEKREVKGTLVPQTIVEIVNDNMPFLVDSVTGAINSLGYSIHLVIHPVMQVERDKAHDLKTIFQPTPEGAKGNYESFIHCEILESSSPEKLKILEDEVTRALNDVKISVEDWMPIRSVFKRL